MALRKKLLLSILLVVGSISMVAGCTAQETDSQSNVSASEESSSGDSATSTVVEWSLDSDCALCHSTAAASLESESHAGHSDLDCATCHTDTAGLEGVHENVSTVFDGTSGLKVTEITEETCLSCHGSIEALAELTADSTALTDEEGTVVNPHDLPQVDQHDSFVCTTCHNEHSDVDVTKNAYNQCVGCHHDNVFECGTCH